MKRRILTTLLTMCMVLMLLRIPAYAGRAYCDICGKWVSTTGTYEYKDAGYHWHHVYCKECGTNITIHVLRMCGAERQPAQADRLARSAEEHPPLSDMIGTQTGFRMKTIIGMSVMSAQKRAMLEYIFGIMAL